MSRPVNALFKIHINGHLINHTPVNVVSGVLHCVEVPRVDGDAGTQFLPVAYFAQSNVTFTSVNSLTSIRQHPFDYTAVGLGDTFEIRTDVFHMTKVDGRLTIETTPRVAYTEYDVTVRPLRVNELPSIEAVQFYNDVDSDVVLTSATPTTRTLHHPSEQSILLKSKVLTLIYSALFSHSNAHPNDPDFSHYILLANLQDMAEDATGAPTTVWTFQRERPYDASTGKFIFHSDIELTGQIVDRILDGLMPDLLQRNDTLDITVNGLLEGDVYTTSLRYSGDEATTPPRRYNEPLFAGLLESSPGTYANKQAVCIALSRYAEGRGENTRAHPPFQFRYKTADQFTVLDEVVLDFARYYYVVYHFAPAIQVRPLPLFTRPTTNLAALRDVVVLSDKYDAYVDLAFTTGEAQHSFITSSSLRASDVVSRIIVTYTIGTASTLDTTTSRKLRRSATRAPTETHEMIGGVGAAGRGRFQFFTNASELYTSRAPEREYVGPNLRLYMDGFGTAGAKHKIPPTTSNVRITVEFLVDGHCTRLVATITQPHIRPYTDPRNAALIELCYHSQAGVLHPPTPTSILDAVRATAPASFNDDISQWDLHAGYVASGHRSLEGLLRDLPAFNQPLGGWNTSGIARMCGLFEGAAAFDQPIGVWDTACATTLARMFKRASRFDQDLADWDVRRVEDFSEMFASATSFNGRVANWQCTGGADASGTVNASRMFAGAASFDRPFAPTGFVVTRCVGMFHGARSFNRPWRHLLSETCSDLTDLFHDAVALVGSEAHDLPAGCVDATSMFEGASSWTAGLVSDRALGLARMTAMYKGATRFNRPVTVTTVAPTLYCGGMFEAAIAMNSHVTFRSYTPGASSDASGTTATTTSGWIDLREMFRNAVSFNRDVLFDRQIRQSSRMFKGALAYGALENGYRPSLGVVGWYLVDFGPISSVALGPWSAPLSVGTRDLMQPTTAPTEPGAAEMFAGSRFNDHVCGRAPPNCAEMFAGAEYYNTTLNMSGFPFEIHGVTSMQRMFKGAIALSVSPFNVNPVVLSSVTAMDEMFADAICFNGDLTGWRDHVASVTSFAGMFRNAIRYQTNITTGVHKWIIGNGVDLEGMFLNASSYPFAPLYSFPKLIATTRSVPVVTFGHPLTMTTRFGQRFPPSATATVLIATPDGQPTTSLVAGLDGDAIAVTFAVQSDAAYTGIVTVVYGIESQTYAWDHGILTSADIYVFPVDFSYHGTGSFGVGITLKQNTPSDLVLTLVGGDLLFSDVVAAQVEYVRYALDGAVTTVDPASLVCSSDAGTITILGLAPAIGMADLTITMRLRGPDGALSAEMTRIVPANEVAPEWLPVAALGVGTTSVPAPYTLVVDVAVELRFAFETTADFPSASTASSLFYVEANAVAVDLVGASVEPTTRTLRLSYAAPGRLHYTFMLFTFGQTYTFSVGVDEVYEFPGIVQTVRSVPFVTLGQALTITSYFTAPFPPELTGSVRVTPQGHDAVVYTALLSDRTLAITIPTVAFDVPHTGAITLAFGDATRPYAWATSTLNADGIYTFASGFVHATSSVFGSRIALKQNTPSDLVLSFTGGDRLYSSDVATQVDYVAYVQNGHATTMDAASLRCSDASGTVTILGLAPVDTTDLTLKVRLRGPDGTLGAEMTRTVSTREIAPEWLPIDASGVVANIEGTSYRLIVDSPVQLAFAFTSAADFPAVPASDLLMLSTTTTTATTATSIATATVSARTITVVYTAAAATSHRFVFTSFYGTSYTFTIDSSEVYALPTMAVSSYHITDGTADDTVLGATGVVMARVWCA